MLQAHRGDLVITRTADKRDDGTHTYRFDRFDLCTVVSCTRTGLAKTLLPITGGAYEAGRLFAVDHATSGNMLVVPATRLHIPEALAAIRASRADSVGRLPGYDSPVDLLRDLNRWHNADPGCLANLRALAFRHVEQSGDQRCATCGVTTYGNGQVRPDTDDCPAAHCNPACPIGVDFATDYPIGLEMRITAGFAAGAIARIERVSDAYPADLDGRTHYAGRTYVLTLPYWGTRGFPETIVCPVDDAVHDRYAVHRTAPSAA